MDIKVGGGFGTSPEVLLPKLVLVETVQIVETVARNREEVGDSGLLAVFLLVLGLRGGGPGLVEGCGRGDACRKFIILSIFGFGPIYFVFFS